MGAIKLVEHFDPTADFVLFPGDCLVCYDRCR